MKIITYALLLLILPAASAILFSDIEEYPVLTDALIGIKIPKEAIFIKDSDIINIYNLDNKDFILSIELESRVIKKVHLQEENADIKVYITEEAVNNIISSKNSVDTILKEIEENKLKIEPQSFYGKIKYALMIASLKLSKIW